MTHLGFFGHCMVFIDFHIIIGIVFLRNVKLPPFQSESNGHRRFARNLRNLQGMNLDFVQAHAFSLHLANQKTAEYHIAGPLSIMDEKVHKSTTYKGTSPLHDIRALPHPIVRSLYFILLPSPIRIT